MGRGEEDDVRFTQAVVEPRLSGRNKRVEGGSGGGWRGGGGLPNKRRHLQQLSQLTGKLWRCANVG